MQLLLTEVYAAGEAPIVAAGWRWRARYAWPGVWSRRIDDVATLPQAIVQTARAGDVITECVGAGSIGQVPAKVVVCLQNKELLALTGEHI